jgi:tetratricopeptide (TPR) repeat protein
MMEQTPDDDASQDGRPRRGRPAQGRAGRGRPAWQERGGRPARADRDAGDRVDRGRGRRRDAEEAGRSDRDRRGRGERGARLGRDRAGQGEGGVRSGRDRAGQGEEAPRGQRPFRGVGRAAGNRVAKPRLPEERPRLQREAYRDLRGSVSAGRLDDVIRAYGAAGAAMEEGEPERAVPYLEWAKSVAPRSAAVREALGIARYLTGDFAAASAELTAYRRLSGREDQNHLLADSARAAGRPDKVGEYVEAMVRDPRVDTERQVEGLIVLAADLADRGDVDGALAVLGRAGLHPRHIEPWHPRLWYAAADLAARRGDREREREFLEAIVAVDEDFLDADERLRNLGD